MKTKVIFSILIVLSNFFAYAGERVYIRTFTANPTIAKTIVVIYEKGQIQEIETSNYNNKRTESLKSLAQILEKYFSEGYKLIGTSQGVSQVACSEYILEKP